MSRLRSIFGVSVRTFERWCAAGDVPGAYRTKGGHWRVRRPSPRLISQMLTTPDYWKIRKWRNVERLFFYFSLRAASPEIKRRLEHLRPLFLQGMTNGKQLNDALNIVMALNGISPEHRGEMDSEKRHLFYDTPIAKLLTPNIWKMAGHPSTALHVSAKKLRNNDQPVNSATLAADLGISVSTLYRRFALDAIRRLSRPPPPIVEPLQPTAAKKSLTVNYSDENFRDEGL